ncbi:FG-GAP repeat protein [Bradyrhizobium lablabi]|uniref:beta strand repeat-containing protein n=1 Tax=Bradyrhizobium lablabi TaxID=722472 RepID=UPI001BA64925|nr:FG-GAP-like repeat-containing protein [Bradyrhizobium lablabi]MBR1120289.1 FG-GAP repeat protein [Bradyrhizobium lablabi]
MAQYTSFGYDFTSAGHSIWAFQAVTDPFNASYNAASSNSGRLVYDNSDGTKTWINGTGLNVNGVGTIGWTTLTSLEHRAADGTLLESITSLGTTGANPGGSGPNGLFYLLMAGADTATGSTGTDALHGGEGADVLYGGAGVDILGGGYGNDTFRLAAGDFVAGETIVGDQSGTDHGNDTLQLENVGSIDLRNGNVIGIDTVVYFSGTSSLTIGGTTGGTDEIKTFVGSAGADSLTLAAAAGMNLSSLVFTNWTAGQDTITIVLRGGNFGGVTGTVKNDIITFDLATAGGPSVNGEAGDDVFVFSGTSNGSFIIDGGIGADTIKAQNVTLDFSQTTFASIESFVFDSGASTVKFSQAQITSGNVPAFTGSANVDTIIISHPTNNAGHYSLDASTLVLNSWTDAADMVILDSNAGGGTGTLTGSSHRDTIYSHGGHDALNGKGGADLLYGGAFDDKFVFDAVALTDAQSAIIDHVMDYNLSEGDKIDLSALLSAAYNQGSGQPLSSLVRVVAGGGNYANLEIDINGTVGGANWTTIAHLDGVLPGSSISVILDSALPAGSTVKAGTSSRDFGGDWKSDIIWRNDAGATSMWAMNGSAIDHATSLGTMPATWTLAGTGDFNGDGKNDLLWRNETAGTAQIWNMNDGTILQANSLGIIPSNWKVLGVGDFNGDGMSDIVWRNNAGATSIWAMNGGVIHHTSTLGTVPTNWTLAGTGDFNGDGKSDLLWRNEAAGAAQIWDMNDGTILQANSLGIIPSNWKALGVGDFNGDGMSDIVWRNNAGATSIWAMNDGVIHHTSSLGTVPSNWNLAGTGDYNGDGKSDLLWRNETAGAAQIWNMNDGAILHANSLGVIPANWHIIA